MCSRCMDGILYITFYIFRGSYSTRETSQKNFESRNSHHHGLRNNCSNDDGLRNNYSNDDGIYSIGYYKFSFCGARARSR